MNTATKATVTKAILAATMMAASTSALAYQTEITPYYETSSQGSTDADEIGITAIHYFTAIEDSDAPRTEAAFLQRASAVGVSLSKISEEDNDDGYKVEEDSISAVAAVRYIPSGTSLIITAGAETESGDVKYPEGDAEGASVKRSLSFRIGSYIGSNSALQLRYSTDLNYGSVYQDGLGFDYAYSRTNALAAQGRSVIAMNNGMHATLEAALYRINYQGDDAHSNGVELGATLHPTRDLSVGVEVLNTYADFKAQYLTLNANYFFTPLYSAALEFSRVDIDATDDNLNSTMISFTGRF